MGKGVIVLDIAPYHHSAMWKTSINLGSLKLYHSQAAIMATLSITFKLYSLV